MKKIIITKGIMTGSTMGAFMYAYYINFNGNYAYSFQATEEGMMYATKAWEEAGYEINWKETSKDG